MSRAKKPFATRHPESLMMSYGYRPELSEGSLKSPIFQTSTFVFKNAEEGRRFFETAYGLRAPRRGESSGLIYSRINNPDLEILEDRLALWDGAEASSVFSSGMAAITTAILAFASPGDLIVHSEPLYGGTDHFFKSILPRFGVETAAFPSKLGPGALSRRLGGSRRGRLAMVFVETPANPTNEHTDIRACAAFARVFSSRGRRAVLAVDNTFLGPLWQRPLDHGADLSIYSATKFLGGHSDLIAGVCSGAKPLLAKVREMRTFLGSMASPWTGWLLLRSLETLKIRMTEQARNAEIVARHLARHPRVERVYYPGLLKADSVQGRLFSRQCLGPGSMISFDVRGGRARAYRFLDALRLVHLTVSLGGTESLAEHPATMTHCDVSAADKKRFGIGEGMVRLSVGIENHEDLLADLDAALAA